MVVEKTITRIQNETFNKHIKANRVVTTQDLLKYKLNDIDDSVANVKYIGTETIDGDWIINKIDQTTGLSSRWANVSNNADKTSYTLAWTNRASLTYELLGNLTI